MIKIMLFSLEFQFLNLRDHFFYAKTVVATTLDFFGIFSFRDIYHFTFMLSYAN